MKQHALEYPLSARLIQKKQQRVNRKRYVFVAQLDRATAF